MNEERKRNTACCCAAHGRLWQHFRYRDARRRLSRHQEGAGVAYGTGAAHVRNWDDSRVGCKTSNMISLERTKSYDCLTGTGSGGGVVCIRSFRSDSRHRHLRNLYSDALLSNLRR